VCGGLQVVKSKEDTLQTQRRAWKYFQQCKVVHVVVGKCLAAVLAIFIVSAAPMVDRYGQVTAAYAAPATTICASLDDPIWRRGVSEGGRRELRRARLEGQKELCCVKSEHTRIVPAYHCQRNSHTLPQAQWTPLEGESERYVRTSHVTQASVTKTRAESHQGKRMSARAVRVTRNTSSSVNTFAFGQCTWWANQRYHQLHGVFVPWGNTNADAAQWTQRARKYGWRVSKKPKVGSIAVMQPGVQGAYGYGHVAVVERILRDGSVIVSSMNWGRYPRTVTRHHICPGRGVAFVRQK
jgi:surface antigen